MRLAKRLSTFEDDNILHLIDKACLTRLFKSASRTTIAFAFGDLVNLITFVMLLLLRTGECNLSVNLILFFLHVLASSKIPESPCIIKTHPQFRVFVLANRPGFPFLGNDFFEHWVNNNNICIPFVLFLLSPLVYGDAFGAHAVDNPDPASELSMLRKYGPSVDEGILAKIVAIFGELREMADLGDVSYPFSTREAVSIMKHLEVLPHFNLIYFTLFY